MFERYTEKARKVIFFARYEASQFGSPCIDTEHLLLGLLREDQALAKDLSSPSFTLESVRKRIEEHASPREKVSMGVDMPLSARCKRVLTYAAEEAERLRGKHIGTEHLLLGLLREQDSLAAKILFEAGFNASELRDKIGRTTDASGKLTRVQPANLEDYVEIHGELWSANFVRELGEYYRNFHWEKRQWVARDALVQRLDKTRFLYAGQTFDPEQAELVKGGWKEDHCVICWWEICESSAAERGVGYTNGQDWLCSECYERFLSPAPPTGS